MTRGGTFAWIFLALHGVMNLVRGSIHVFRDDGGAASIAGIDLSQNGGCGRGTYTRVPNP